MKILGWQKLQATALILAFVVSMFAPGIVAATTHHEGMNHHDALSSPGCQQRCNPTTPSATQTSKKQRQSKPEPRPDYQRPLVSSFASFDEVKELVVSPSEDFRLLRPPDKLVLNGIFRF